MKTLQEAAEQYLNQPVAVSLRRRDWFILAMLLIGMKGGLFGGLPETSTAIPKMLDLICAACGKRELEIVQMVAKWEASR